MEYIQPYSVPKIRQEEAAKKLLRFTDKDSYLNWVANWKSIWKELSERQRELKSILRQNHNEIDEKGRVEFHKKQAEREKSGTADYGFYLYWPLSAQYMSEKSSNRSILRILHYARRFGKEKSWEMKQKSLES